MSTEAAIGDAVAELMSPVTAVAGPGAGFKDLARLFDEHGVDALPVVDSERRVLGIVTASDLLVRLAGVRIAPHGQRPSRWAAVHRKVHAGTAESLMSAPPLTVTPTTSAMEAGRLAARTRVHVLPVVDESGVLVGMLTRRDLVRLYLRPDRDIHDGVVQAVGRTGEAVAISVVDGVVTLEGEVADPLAARELVDETRAVPGVVDVRNRLNYVHDLAG